MGVQAKGYDGMFSDGPQLAKMPAPKYIFVVLCFGRGSFIFGAVAPVRLGTDSIRNKIMDNITQITPQQLHILLGEREDVVLLDVREDCENAYCALPGNVHIPMDVLGQRQGELPDGRPIVVYCHHGVRSMHCAMYLADAGFGPVYNLAGGIDAWARDVEPEMPRY